MLDIESFHASPAAELQRSSGYGSNAERERFSGRIWNASIRSVKRSDSIDIIQYTHSGVAPTSAKFKSIGPAHIRAPSFKKQKQKTM